MSGSRFQPEFLVPGEFPKPAAVAERLVVVRLGRLFRLAEPFGGFCDQRYPVGFPLSVRFPVEREEF